MTLEQAKRSCAGLYIKELILRGDLARCLIVAPGGLVEQWQDELLDKFGLRFELLTRAMVEAEPDGNVFANHNLLIARMDMLSRDEDLQAVLDRSDWDLIVVDEAHRMVSDLLGHRIEANQAVSAWPASRRHNETPLAHDCNTARR